MLPTQHSIGPRNKAATASSSHKQSPLPRQPWRDHPLWFLRSESQLPIGPAALPAFRSSFHESVRLTSRLSNLSYSRPSSHPEAEACRKDLSSVLHFFATLLLSSPIMSSLPIL